MTQSDINLTVSALLHDIGKVVYRAGESDERHSISGAKFLKEKAGINDETILNPVRYHHAMDLRNADLDEKDSSYIVYMADNISSAIDRRESESGENGFDKTVPLAPVFNLMNKNHSSMYYSPYTDPERIHYPEEQRIDFSVDAYKEVLDRISDNIKGVDTFSEEYLSSLIEVLEANLSFVPSSTSKGEVPDISLFDHSRLTAAFALALKAYLDDRKYSYKEKCFIKQDELKGENCFLLASLDISGIQKFIYTISTKDALKSLRARSFYLDFLMEDLVDELLKAENLCRANLTYCGGGHAYIILPNTESAKETFDKFVSETNAWFINEFKNALYIAGAYSECSMDSLRNEPNGSYAEIYRNISRTMSDRKMHRYSADDIRKMNAESPDDFTRECSSCKRLGKLIKVEDEDSENETYLCPTCYALKNLSKNIQYSNFFAVVDDDSEDLLKLPFGKSLKPLKDEKEVRELESSPSLERVYSTNKMYTGRHISTKIWVGNYFNKEARSFGELAEKSTGGFKKIGVLRADVDNLGQVFVSGFSNKENNDRYVTISRTSTFSRQMSLFFKHYINYILANPEYTITGVKKEMRNAAVVYSGGDDVFLVGAWDDILEAAVDLRNAFRKYTESTLSISAGIGIYDDSYPISVIADEVAEMEEKSKHLKDKDAITLFEDGEKHYDAETKTNVSDGTMHWDELLDKVIGEKYKALESYLMSFEDRGNSFLYHILDLIRHVKEDKINFARYVYYLARLEPAKEASSEQKKSYREFSKNMYAWIQDEKDSRELKMAINIYVYLHRKEEE